MCHSLNYRLVYNLAQYHGHTTYRFRYTTEFAGQIFYLQKVTAIIAFKPNTYPILNLTLVGDVVDVSSIVKSNAVIV